MILEITILFLKIHFLNYKKVMSPEEIYSQLLVSLWILNLCLKCYTFCLYFILYLNVWIRIHKASEYGSNTDPDPQHWFIYSKRNLKNITSYTEFSARKWSIYCFHKENIFCRSTCGLRAKLSHTNSFLCLWTLSSQLFRLTQQNSSFLIEMIVGELGQNCGRIIEARLLVQGLKTQHQELNSVPEPFLARARPTKGVNYHLTVPYRIEVNQHFLLYMFKGIVSRDWGELQMIPVDSLEVFSIAGSYFYFF